MRVALSPILLILLLAPSVGFSQPQFEIQFSYPSPGSGSFTETTSGNFDTDLLEDFAYIQGDQVYFVSGPGLYAVRVPVPHTGSVSAIATLPAESESDELLFADDNGLQALQVSTTGFETRSIAGGSWANARALAVGMASTPSGVPAIYGISADGTEVLTWIEGVGNSIGIEQAYDLTAVSWVPGHDNEVIAVTVTEDDLNWIFFAKNDGQILYALWNPEPAADITTLNVADGPKVAAVGKAPFGSDDWVVVVGSEFIPDFTNIGTVDAVGLSSGDVDNDGNEDLIVSHRSSDSIYYLTYPFFDGAQLELTAPKNSPNPTNTHTPLLLDADQDDDLDLIQLSEINSPSEIVVTLQEPQLIAVPPEEGSNDFGSSNTNQPELKAFHYFEDDISGVNMGYICFRVVRPLAGYPQGTNHVEIGLWKSEYQNGNWSNPTPFGRIHSSIEGPTPPAVHTMAFEVDLSTHGQHTVYYWAARYIQGDPVTQSYARVYPPLIGSFTPTVMPNSSAPSLIRLAELNSSYNVGTLTPVYDLDGNGGDPYLIFLNYTPSSNLSGNDLPSNTGTGTPIRPLPDPSEFPDPSFGEPNT